MGELVQAANGRGMESSGAGVRRAQNTHREARSHLVNGHLLGAFPEELRVSG